MNTMQPKKSQTTQNQSTQALWAELSDDVAAQLSGGANLGPLKKGNGDPNPIIVDLACPFGC